VANLDDYLLSFERDESGEWSWLDAEEWVETGRSTDDLLAVHFHVTELDEEREAFLRSLPGLEALGLCDEYDWKEGHLERLGRLGAELGVTGLEVERASDLANTRHFPYLRRIDLRNLYRLTSPNLIPHLAGLRALETLDLRGQDLGDLSGLEGLAAIRRLNVAGNTDVSDAGFLAGMTAIEELDMAGTSVEDVSAVTGLGALRTLSLSGSPISDLTPLAGLKALRELSLDGCDQLTTESLTPLRGLALERLSLRRTPLGPDAVDGLRALGVPEIDLFGSRVPFEVARELGTPARLHPDCEVAGERDQAQEWDFVDADDWSRPLSEVRALQLTYIEVQPEEMGFLALLDGLEALALTGTDGLGRVGLEHVARCPGLQVLILNACDVDPADLGALSVLPNLRELRLAGVELGQGATSALAALSGLHVLDLGSSGITGADLAQLSGLGLRRLRLSETKVAEGLDALPTTLEVLDLANCPLEAPALAGATRLGRLRVLDLTGTRVSELDSLPLLPALQEIVLTRLTLPSLAPLARGGLSRITAQGARLADDALAGLGALRTLEQLNLSGTQVGSAGLEHLRGLPALRSLDLSSTLVDDTAGEALTDLPVLKVLTLNETRVGDAVATRLAGAGLEWVALFGTQVGDAGALALAAATGLVALDLRGTWISDEARTRLEAAGLEKLLLPGQSQEDEPRPPFAGREVVPFAGRLPSQVRGRAWRVSASVYESEFSLEALLSRLLDDPRAAEIEALVIGGWEEAATTPATAALAALVRSAPALPGLRALYLGDMDAEECEISWIQHEDLTPLLEAFPALETLRVRGAEGLTFSQLPCHGALRQLTIECGGLPARILASLSEASLPALEHLELYLGEQDHGWDGSVDDLAPLLSGKLFPRLRFLGLKDSEVQDAVAEAVAVAPILGQLEVLDMSLGTLGDAGAEALLASPAVGALRRLDLRHHFLSPEVQDKLRGVGCEVELSDPQTAYRDGDGEELRFVAVGE
jgi:Leucine-rich repeat (LRR) protein